MPPPSAFDDCQACQATAHYRRIANSLSVVMILTSFIATYALIAITPGPNMAVVVQASLRHGRRRALMAAAGVAIGAAMLTTGVIATAIHVPRTPVDARGVSVLYGLFVIWMSVGLLSQAVGRRFRFAAQGHRVLSGAACCLGQPVYRPSDHHLHIRSGARADQRCRAWNRPIGISGRRLLVFVRGARLQQSAFCESAFAPGGGDGAGDWCASDRPGRFQCLANVARLSPNPAIAQAGPVFWLASLARFTPVCARYPLEARRARPAGDVLF